MVEDTFRRKNSVIIPETLYHATFEPLVNNIIKRGLIPGGTTFQSFNFSEKGYVFLASNEKLAEEVVSSAFENMMRKHPQEWNHDKINILTIDTRKLNKQNFSMDEAMFFNDTSYKYKGIIPPSAIVDYGD